MSEPTEEEVREVARRTKPEDLDRAALDKAAHAAREEFVRQYRDDDRRRCPAGAFFYEQHIGPEYVAVAAICAYLDAIGAVEVPVLKGKPDEG